MNSSELENDIPLSLAQAAHEGTSFVPDKRAQQERREYAATLAQDYADLSQLTDTDEKRQLLEADFLRYQEGYKAKTIAWLQARSRCLSPMITGPARFPTRQNEKRNDTAHRRLTELLEFRKRALEVIRRKLQPELRPIMAGDEDAKDRLLAKIAHFEQLQANMKAINKIVRNKKLSSNQKATAVKELGFSEVIAKRVLTPDWLNNVGFPSYELTNNNAQIRRLKQRLEQITKTKAAPQVSMKGDGVTLEDCPSDNRVRLFFSGKPPAEIRTKLKSCGFRWAPSIGCWQAYRNTRSLSVAKEFVCQPA